MRGRQDNDVVRRQPLEDLVDELLDAAGARREVVRDDEGAPHRDRGWSTCGGGTGTPFCLAQSRARPIRSGVEGWVENSMYCSGLGCRPPTLLSVSWICDLMKSDGSRVRLSE